jgi:hypothetical protein
LPGFQPRLGGQAAQAALDVEERVDAPDGLQRDRGDRVDSLYFQGKAGDAFALDCPH